MPDYLDKTGQETIVAPATPPGHSALAVIRMSGMHSISIAAILIPGPKLLQQASHTAHWGRFILDNDLIDEVVVTLFRAPKSYTGEDLVEISCHGSPYIVKKIIACCVSKGARLAEPGEFTRRAFMQGKLDLSQAEAVADLIAAEQESQHKLAIQQLRGDYVTRLQSMREQLIDFSALIELELDFSEEDVEFANRTQLLQLIDQILHELNNLIHSFRWGNAIKNGIAVALVGKPNAGKSTLLNRLVQDERALVSEVAGTTRDFIEDQLHLHGITYRFIDTAGLRNTEDALEAAGITRSYEKMREATIILYLADIREPFQEIVKQVQEITLAPHQRLLVILTKADAAGSTCDAFDIEEAVATLSQCACLAISARDNWQIDKLLNLIHETHESNILHTDVLVSNLRHLEAFQDAARYLEVVKQGLQSRQSGEFISVDLRAALDALGRITGTISREDVLGSVFSRFCIGK